MTTLEEAYEFEVKDLKFEIKPFTYETTIQAGLTNFQSTRSLQAIADLPDDLDKLKVFNESFLKLADLNFKIMIEVVDSITLLNEDEEVVVSDKKHIREFLENCEAEIGTAIESRINDVANVGIAKDSIFECEDCNESFESAVAFDPVNFFTAS